MSANECARSTRCHLNQNWFRASLSANSDLSRDICIKYKLIHSNRDAIDTRVIYFNRYFCFNLINGLCSCNSGRNLKQKRNISLWCTYSARAVYHNDVWRPPHFILIQRTMDLLKMHDIISNFLCGFSFASAVKKLLPFIYWKCATLTHTLTFDIFYFGFGAANLNCRRNPERGSSRSMQQKSTFWKVQNWMRIVVIIISLLWFWLELRLSVGKKFNFCALAEKKLRKKKSHYISENSRQNERILFQFFFNSILFLFRFPFSHSGLASGCVCVCVGAVKSIFCSFVTQFVVNQTMNTYELHMAACPGVLSHANSKVWLQHFAFG